ncbi:MAG: flagellar basal body-associated FliL family protein [Acidimicrobiales bacterium]|nr:flagellar basal body-associated FliL family protein [Acidimicrobiales bacterium]
MSDEKSEEDGKKGKKKKAIIAGVVLLGAAYQFVLKPSPPPEDPAAAGEEVEIEEGDVVPLPELVVNLADTEEIRYLRVGVAVVLEKGVDGGAVEPELPRISDIVIDMASEYTFEELRADGAKQALKDRLSEAARIEFDDSTVARIIFTTFVMQ